MSYLRYWCLFVYNDARCVVFVPCFSSFCVSVSLDCSYLTFPLVFSNGYYIPHRY